MTKKGRPASVKKQWAAQRERGVGLGMGVGERDGGAGLMKRKLRGSPVRARGNEEASGTGSIHPEVVICD